MDNLKKPYEIVNILLLHLDEINNSVDEIINKCERAIGVCLLAIHDLHDFVRENKFNSKEEEIEFFKNIKPIAFSEYLFFSFLLDIEKKPYSSKKIRIRCLRIATKKSQEFLELNKEFYSYFVSKSTYLDDKYYVRTKSFKCLNTHHFIVDLDFSTSHDYTLSAIMAHQKVIDYCINQIEVLKSKGSVSGIIKQPPLKTNLKWTESKTALVELIYALHSSWAINNGNSDIKELVKVFESVFNTNLNNYYHTFIEIRSRKKGQVKFLDTIKQAMIKRMEDADE